jgi:hypothetical protein
LHSIPFSNFGHSIIQIIDDKHTWSHDHLRHHVGDFCLISGGKALAELTGHDWQFLLANDRGGRNYSGQVCYYDERFARESSVDPFTNWKDWIKLLFEVCGTSIDSF